MTLLCLHGGNACRLVGVWVFLSFHNSVVCAALKEQKKVLSDLHM